MSAEDTTPKFLIYRYFVAFFRYSFTNLNIRKEPSCSKIRCPRRPLTAPIVIAIGSNLSSPQFGPPRAVCEAALAELSRRGITIVSRSRWFESAPVPVSDQPWFVNGVAIVETALPPEALLVLLHEVERQFGRERRELNAARILDLDLIAYGDLRRTV